ncbi:MAG: AraC family transcriptional regulator [Paenibacillaceae bacterium]|nr:AraC family transcriptional regulator [Paenibacillaceae bacterium]
MLNAIRQLNIYYRHMLLVFAVTCLPMAVIAVSNYWIGTNQIKAEIIRNHKLQLSKISRSLEEELSRLGATGNQWSFNPAFGEKLGEGDLRLKHNETRELLASLRILQEANPLIENAVLYLPKDNLLVSEVEGITTIEDDARKAVFHELLVQRQALFWWQVVAGPLKYRSSTPIALVHQLQNENLEPYGAILFYLSKQRLDDMLYALNPDGQGVAFILKEDGGWVTNGPGEFTNEQNLLNEAIRQEIRQRGMESGDFLYDRNHVSYSVSVGELSRNGWKYAVGTPVTTLTAPVLLMLKLSLAVCLFGLLIAFALSWFASRKIYRPIRHVVGLMKESAGVPLPGDSKDEFVFMERRWRTLDSESRELKANLEQGRQLIKEGFLRQWIQGHLAYLTEEELAARTELDGWSLPGQGFAVLLVRLSDITETMGRFHKGDELLATFAAANIAEEIVSFTGTKAEVINLYDLTIAVLVAYDAGQPRELTKRGLFQFAERLIGEMASFLRMRVTVGVSKLTGKASQVHVALDEVKQLIRFRDIDKKAQILDAENLLPSRLAPVSYPFDCEHELIQFIRLGMEEEAVRQLQFFVSGLKQGKGNELTFRQGMLQLLGAILQALMKAGIEPGSLYRGNDLYGQLGGLRDIDDIRDWFERGIIRPFVELMADNRDKLQEQIVDNVIAMINERYAQAISLESCADEVGITSYNLSKAFKYHTGVNFIDYLTGVRMTRAKSLLVGSEMKINEIAEQVGYQPGYFVRIFKKSEGVTPGVYRERYHPGRKLP